MDVDEVLPVDEYEVLPVNVDEVLPVDVDELGVREQPKEVGDAAGVDGRLDHLVLVWPSDSKPAPLPVEIEIEPKTSDRKLKASIEGSN